MLRAVSLSTVVLMDGASGFVIIFFFFGVNMCTEKNQPVYGNETWHTDRVLKPHVQCRTKISPVLFGAPSGGVKSNRGIGPRQIRRFSTHTSSYLRNGTSEGDSYY